MNLPLCNTQQGYSLPFHGREGENQAIPPNLIRWFRPRRIYAIFYINHCAGADTALAFRHGEAAVSKSKSAANGGRLAGTDGEVAIAKGEAAAGLDESADGSGKVALGIGSPRDGDGGFAFGDTKSVPTGGELAFPYSEGALPEEEPAFCGGERDLRLGRHGAAA